MHREEINDPGTMQRIADNSRKLTGSTALSYVDCMKKQDDRRVHPKTNSKVSKLASGRIDKHKYET